MTDISERVREGLRTAPTRPPTTEAWRAVQDRAGREAWREARPLLAVAVTVLIAGLLVLPTRGGSGDDESIVAISELRARVADRGSYRFEATFRAVTTFADDSMFSAESGEEMATRLRGLTDIRQDRTRQTIEFDVPERFDRSRPGPCEILSTPEHSYARVNEAQKTIYGGKSWVRAARTDTPGLAGATGPLGSSNPDEFLSLLGDTRDWRREGPELVRDVATTRYRVPLDLDRLTEGMSEAERRAMRGQTHPDAVTVWLDADRLPRRIAYGFEGGDPSTRVVSVSASVDLFDFGAEEDLSDPPAQDVFEGDAASLNDACYGSPLQLPESNPRTILEFAPPPDLSPAPGRAE